MAADRWVPPLDVLGELYETVSALSDPQRSIAERIDAIEAAAAAADAWRTYLRDFLEVEIRARWAESRQRRDFTSTVMKSDQWQSLPAAEKQAWMLRDAHFDQRTGDITGMAQRMGERRREAVGIEHEERWAVCPMCAMSGPPTHEPPPTGNTMTS
ncbi:Uncharacterised protein [Mycobacteroides abscessus subsp. bolletii]|nr:Uncharacterised protein [Mycobacteroides abscessus subsp. bolletii]